MASRISAILDAAAKRSGLFIDSLGPDRTKYRRNCVNIGATCKQLLALRPPREPTSRTVSEEGSIKFSGFPKRQTLDNAYASYLAIWREAFDELCDIGATKTNLDPENINFTRSDLASLDEGTRHRIQLLVALFREATNRNNDLQKVIHRNVTLDERGQPKLVAHAPAVDPEIKSEVTLWLGQLQNGTSPLDLEDLGVRLSRRARPGMLIIPRAVIDALSKFVT